MINVDKRRFLRDGVNIAWLVLVSSTLFGWWLGHVVNSAQDNARLAVGGVLIMAFVKIWVVGFEFMELKQAPGWLRYSFDVWVVVMCVVLLVLLCV